MDDKKRDAGLLLGIGLPWLVGASKYAEWFIYGGHVRGILAMIGIALMLWGFLAFSEMRSELGSARDELRRLRLQ